MEPAKGFEPSIRVLEAPKSTFFDASIGDTPVTYRHGVFDSDGDWLLNRA